MLAILATEKPAGREVVRSGVYVRRWSEVEFRKLAGTEGAVAFSFSPSGSLVGCFVPDEVLPKGEIRLVPVDGGPAMKLREFTQQGLLAPWGGNFLTDEELLIPSQDGRELYLVAGSSGAPRLVATFGAEAAFHNVDGVPRPGGRYAVVTRWKADNTSSLHRVDLETGEASPVLEDALDARFLESGHLVFERDGRLWVAPCDLDRAVVTGAARVCLSGFSEVSLDRSGDRAVYQTKSELEGKESIVVVDSSGGVVQTLMDSSGDYERMALSPDGRRLAYQEDRGDVGRIWVLDIASGLSRPVTPEGEIVWGPAWTADGRVTYARVGGADVHELMVKDPTPGGTPELLLPRREEGPVGQDNPTFSPDGRYVILSHYPYDGREPGIYLFDVGDGDSGRAFYASQASEGYPAFRPDGKWVAYSTNGTGRQEVYLRPFDDEKPESRPIYPVTRGGGIAPMWSADGGTLYYSGAEGDEAETIFAVTVETEPELTISERRVALTGVTGWTVPTPDGRFIMVKEAEGLKDRRPDVRLILNWGLGE